MNDINHHELEAQLTILGLWIDNKTKDRLLWLAKELLRWNRQINLTAITTLSEVINKHLVDSLTVLLLLNGSERVLDLGSGGGFPGLPIKIARDELDLVSVDAVAKKISFQRHVIRQLNLTKCTLLNLRAEDVPHWADFRNGFDRVVARAFSSLIEFVSLGLPCLTAGGRLIAMKGPEGEKELHEAKSFLDDLEVVCIDIKKLRLPGSGADRLLISLIKKEPAQKDHLE